MPIHFEIDGVKFVCDKASEAKELVDAFGPAQARTPKLNGVRLLPRDAVTTAANGQQNKKFSELLLAADPQGIELLRLAQKYFPNHVIAEEAVKELRLNDTNELGWIKRKLGMVASALDMDLERYLVPDKAEVNGKLKTAYRATPLLIRALEETQQTLPS
jgi:hypothetical protein